MNRNYSITVDVGTTNLKVSLFENQTGKLADRKTFLTYKIKDEFGEQFDLKKIWGELLEVLKDFVNSHMKRIESIVFSSVGEAGVLIDEHGDVATPLIAWYDKRAKHYVETLTNSEKRRIYEITGLPVHTNYSIPKIKWLIDYMDNQESSSYVWLNITDLFSYFLTGEMKTDYSMASRTMCFDLRQRCWSNEVLEMFGLCGKVSFPEVVSSGEVIGKVTINELPDHEINVRIAGHDHMVGALGINFQSKDLLNSTGTTEGLLSVGEELSINDEYFENSFSNGIFTKSELYTLFSSMPTGGNAFEWYQNFFGIDKKLFLKDSNELYEKYREGQLDLENQSITIPHLNGSGAPYKSTLSKGMVYGLDLNSDRQDLLMSILLGLSFEMKFVALRFHLEQVEKIIVIGPATKNPLWLQMKADALNKEVWSVCMEEAVSLGALKSADEDFDFDIKYEVIKPISKNVEIFRRLFPKYERMYKFKKTLV